jgi:hypothetical protein
MLFPVRSSLSPVGGAAARAQSELLTGLVAYWKLDEASGTRVDATGRGNNLTDFNSVGTAAGIVGSSAQFVAASSKYLGCASTADLTMGTSNFTISAWVRPDTTGGVQVIAAKGSTAAASSYETSLIACHSGLSNVCLFSISDGVTQRIVAGPVLTTGAWHYVVGWLDRPADRIYIQVDGGVPASEILVGYVIPSAGLPFALGRSTFGHYLNGRLDEVGIWKRVLTTAERASLYNGGAGRTYPFA